MSGERWPLAVSSRPNSLYRWSETSIDPISWRDSDWKWNPPLACTNTYKIGSENRNWPGAASALPCTRRLGGRGDQGSLTDGSTQNHAGWIKDNSPQTQHTFTKTVQISIANSTFYWSLLSFRIKTCSLWISSFLSCGSYLRKELDVNWPLNMGYGESFYWGPDTYLPSNPGDLDLIRLTSLRLRSPDITHMRVALNCLQDPFQLRSPGVCDPPAVVWRTHGDAHFGRDFLKWQCLDRVNEPPTLET